MASAKNKITEILVFRQEKSFLMRSESYDIQVA